MDAGLSFISVVSSPAEECEIEIRCAFCTLILTLEAMGLSLSRDEAWDWPGALPGSVRAVQRPGALVVPRGQVSPARRLGPPGDEDIGSEVLHEVVTETRA